MPNVSANPATGTVDQIFSYQDFFNRDYSTLSNTKQIGTYYTRGMNIGQHKVIEYGDIGMLCYEIEKLTPTYTVGLNNSLDITTTTSYEVVNQITATAQISVGIQQMASAGVSIEGIGNVGSSNTLTTEYDFSVSTTFSESLSYSYEIETSINLSNIPNDKLTYRVSRVAVYLKFHVNSSYVEEHFWGKWWPQKSGKLTDYDIYYYIADLETFVYNDNTFGDAVVGTYDLSVLKIY